MKLRLAAQGLRLRILRSEMARLEAGESLEETVRLAPGPNGCITYTLEVATGDQSDDVEVFCVSGAVRVVVAHEVFSRWRKPDEVGVYARVETGDAMPLEVVIEKDFACLDRSEAENGDTFEHPQMGTVC